MAKLPKLTLTHNEKKDRWDLTTGGALEKAAGKDGGSVKIQKVDGQFQEERTYPRAADPKKSPG